ncbi:hypothetical protein [Rhizobium oryziradicis]|uniref:hypothetical protein n=1 Tax=Rhizobium oryziradicis TaxID=1867956 RepID=UPI0011151BC9|nr:hypothetical protein [Rhizobium oryziradicis]
MFIHLLHQDVDRRFAFCSQTVQCAENAAVRADYYPCIPFVSRSDFETMLANSGLELSGSGGFSNEFLDSQFDRRQVESRAFCLLMLGVRESFGGQLDAGAKRRGKTVRNAGHSTIPEASDDCCRVLAGYEGMTKGIFTPSRSKLVEDSVKR